ncbi:glutaredoxin family protein [Caldimonas sp. KR1-144]|uniref:glutaredoxin family protein n=1 Tax=Caldimonas sp. KR1-144 TaxID=3400911 RepID=UPI003C0BE12C
MKSRPPTPSIRSIRSIALAALPLLLGASPAWAVFKVIGPNGQVTYSDRPPSEPAARVQQLSPQATPLPANNLPPVLREATARYPVTLYTMPDCNVCDSARAYLRRRGIPYAESTISTIEDRSLFAARFNNSLTVPVLTIGSQKLEAFEESTWASYLDAAGYPKSSALPVGYTPTPPTPLAPRAGDAARAPSVPRTPLSDAPQRRPDEPATPIPPGFKF